MTDRNQQRRRKAGIMVGAAAGAIGLTLLLIRGAARDEARVLYAPIDRLKPVADDLWIVDGGPVRPMGMALPVRMTVIRLSDGGLLLHSPTRYTPELAAALAALGPVRHLVAPTVAHWAFLAEWQRAVPDALCWAVPALRDRSQPREAGVRIDAVLGDVAPDAWADTIEQGIVRGGGFEEAWFFHRGSRTLILTDLVENLDPAKLTPMSAAVMRLTFATSATTGLQVRGPLLAGGQATRDAIETMVATAPDRVIFAHGDPFTVGAADRLRRALAWAI